jgi:hypothetical protein
MRSRWKSNNNDETATAVAVPPRQGISSPNNNFNFNSRMGEESGAKLSILEMEIAATTPSVKPRRRFTTSESDDNTAEMVDVENTSENKCVDPFLLGNDF